MNIVALTERTALPRKHYSFLKTAHLKWLLLWMRGLFRPQLLPPTAKLNEHYLRDIGMAEADFAAQRHEFPSQTTYHPRG